MTPDEAKARVLAVHPTAFVFSTKTRFTVRVEAAVGWTMVISGYATTEAAAWLSAARRLEREGTR